MLLMQRFSDRQRQHGSNDNGNCRIKAGGRQLADHSQQGSLRGQTVDQQAALLTVIGKLPATVSRAASGVRPWISRPE